MTSSSDTLAANPTRELAAIMFSDIVGHTAIMGRDDDVPEPNAQRDEPKMLPFSWACLSVDRGADGQTRCTSRVESANILHRSVESYPLPFRQRKVPGHEPFSRRRTPGQPSF